MPFSIISYWFLQIACFSCVSIWQEMLDSQSSALLDLGTCMLHAYWLSDADGIKGIFRCTIVLKQFGWCHKTIEVQYPAEHTTTPDHCKANNCYVTMKRLPLQLPPCKPAFDLHQGQQQKHQIYQRYSNSLPWTYCEQPLPDFSNYQTSKIA